MILIKKDDSTMKVSKGAYEIYFKKIGYKIVNEEKEEPVEILPKEEVSEEKVEEKTEELPEEEVEELPRRRGGRKAGDK